MHIGGMARRGDRRVYRPVVRSKLVVVEDANTGDQLFDTLSEEYEVPMTYFAKRVTALKFSRILK